MKTRPWIWLALLFVASVVAWAVLIAVAVKHQPIPVTDLETTHPQR